MFTLGIGDGVLKADTLNLALLRCPWTLTGEPQDFDR